MLPIPVIMCVWDRIERLPITFKLLEKQTDLNFRFFIWNNNIGLKNELDALVQNQPFPVAIRHSPQNIGGFGRFHYAKELAKDNPFVIFIDDDEEFDEDMIKVFKNEAKPRSISAFWAFRLNSLTDYWDREAAAPGKRVDYCGTGGMIADSSIFTDVELYDCPKGFSSFEDLWLSYFTTSKRGWSLFKSATAMKIIDDGKDFGLGKEKAKSNFLRYLVAQGWKIKK